jgi:hypothetical protein
MLSARSRHLGPSKLIFDFQEFGASHWRSFLTISPRRSANLGVTPFVAALLRSGCWTEQ